MQSWLKPFFSIWLLGCTNPRKAVRRLAGCPAPGFGLAAVLLRGVFVSLTWYLPAVWMGRLPDPTPSLTLVPAQAYYAFLTWFFPLFTLCVWLLTGAAAHLLLRLGGKPSGIDTILNLDGMSGLLVMLPILLIDWSNLLLGQFLPTIAWGISHLLVDLWPFAFQMTGFHELFGLRWRWAFALTLFLYMLAVPLAMVFMRG